MNIIKLCDRLSLGNGAQNVTSFQMKYLLYSFTVQVFLLFCPGPVHVVFYSNHILYWVKWDF